MAQIWKGRVVNNATGDIVRRGLNAYACKKAQMYADMEKHAVDLLVAEGYGHLLKGNRPLYEHLEEVRALPENVLPHEKVTIGDVAGSTGGRVGDI